MPTLRTLTQPIFIAALSEGLLHIPQCPVLMLPPPPDYHGPWDVAWSSTDYLAITGIRSCVPTGLGFLKGGATSSSCPEGKGVKRWETRSPLQPSSPRKGI